MASVAICPHCYLQLVVPDGLEPDEQVECPTCAQAFSLDRAVLRAIPEVVRRNRAMPMPPDEEPTLPADAPSLQIEPTENLELHAESAIPDTTSDAEFIDQVKSRIEQELSAGGLLPGTIGSLSLESPNILDDPLSLAPTDPDSLDQLQRPTVRLSELTELEDEIPQVEAAEAAAPSKTLDSREVEISDSLVAAEEPASLADPTTDLDTEEAKLISSDAAPSRPAATTLADLMQRSDYIDSDNIHVDDEAAEVPGPLFELPNVPLTPSRNATVEFDPATTFGPAADSEFALDDVDFDSTSNDDAVMENEVFESAAGEIDEDEYVVDATSGDEVDSYEAEAPAYEETSFEEASYDDEPAEYEEVAAEPDAPVFGEPAAAPTSSAPFILPGLPPRRKKRSVVGVLVGAALGGVVGSAGALFVLLWILGPDGDFLQVARYLPSAALPKSFATKPAVVVAQSQPSHSAPAETTDSEPAASKNMPATFTAEVKQLAEESADDPLAATDSDANNHFDEEPSPLDEPAAAPIAEASAAAPLPLQGPSFTVEQLAEALAAAGDAQPGLVTGDLSDAAVRRTKGMSYAKLCDLAEALTFVNRNAPSIESEQATTDSERLFRETLSDPHTRSEVDRIATLWIDSPHRRHGGVFLAGTLNGGAISGDVYEYELNTDDGVKLALLSAEPLDRSVESSHRQVGVVGSIVAHPTADVTGYQGTANRAIWVTRAFPLD